MLSERHSSSYLWPFANSTLSSPLWAVFLGKLVFLRNANPLGLVANLETTVKTIH